MKILFVCTGNTCRSSMAEALARKLLVERRGNSDIEFYSAGVAAFPDDRASREAVEAMAGMGINLRGHRASSLTLEKVLGADLVLTMTRSHREHINNMYPGHSQKVFTLAEYAGSGADVPDPFGQSLDTYSQCALRLKELIARVLDKL